MNTHHRTLPALGTLLLALGLLTVFLTPAAAHVAPWQTRGAYWLPAPDTPDGDHGFALRAETVTEDSLLYGPVMADHVSISLSPPAGTQAQEFDALSVDVYYENEACGAGSPRYSLRIDADGDGARDFFVQAYPGAALGDGCATGTWVTHDLLTDEDARWSVPGAGHVSPAAGQAFLATEHPDHQVLRVDLQWDATPQTGPSVLWFDNLSVHDHTLSEPLVDGELFCPATVEPGFGACPFTIG